MVNIKWEKTGLNSWFYDLNNENHAFGMINFIKDKFVWKVFSDSCMNIGGTITPHFYGSSSTLEDAQLNVEGNIGKIAGE